MSTSHMALRMELLEQGEALGWPRMPRLRAGKGNWERLARGPFGNVAATLRNAKVRAANLGGEKEDPMIRLVTYDDYVKYEFPAPQALVTATSQPMAAREGVMETGRPGSGESRGGRQPEKPPSTYTAEMRRANLAKAREARRAKAAAV